MKIRTVSIIFLVVMIHISLGINYVFCQDQGDSLEQGQLNEGLDHVAIGPGVSIVAPKGARVDDKSGVVKVEGAKAFSGRKFEDVESRLDELEKNQIELKKEIDKLSIIVTALQKDTSVSKK